MVIDIVMLVEPYEFSLLAFCRDTDAHNTIKNIQFLYPCYLTMWFGVTVCSLEQMVRTLVIMIVTVLLVWNRWYGDNDSDSIIGMEQMVW